MLGRIVFSCMLALLSTGAAAQIPVGAGSQKCREYLQARRGKSTGDTVRESMIVSWVQGYLVGRAEGVTGERIAPEIADRIVRGELPPDLDVVFSDPKGRLLTILQAKFGTRSGWIFDPPDPKSIEVWLVKYCRDHPSNRVSKASDALAAEIEGRAKRK